VHTRVDLSHLTRLIVQEMFYYIHYAVPYHVIAEIISSRLYSWLPFPFFCTIHVSVTRHFSVSKKPVLKTQYSFLPSYFFINYLFLKPNTFKKIRLKLQIFENNYFCQLYGRSVKHNVIETKHN